MNLGRMLRSEEQWEPFNKWSVEMKSNRVHGIFPTKNGHLHPEEVTLKGANPLN